MAYLTPLTLILMYMNYGIGAPSCDDPPKNDRDYDVPFHESLNDINQTIKVPPQLVMTDGIDSMKWNESDTEIEIYLDDTTLYAQRLAMHSQDRGWLTMILVKSGYLDGQIIQVPYSSLKLEVDHDYEYQLGPTAVELIQPNLNIEDKDCHTERKVRFSLRYKHGNLKELGMVAIVYVGANPQHMKEQDYPFLVARAFGSMEFHLNNYEDADKPFCIGVELLDITGQRSPRSAPLCLDPRDGGAPYISGEDAPGRVGCSSIGDKQTKNNAWMLFLILLGCIGLRKTSFMQRKTQTAETT